MSTGDPITEMDAQNPGLEAFRSMLLIRRVEEKILELFSSGEVSGTTHTCLGQEADAVGLIGQLDPARDFVLSNHRNHGHYLAFGGSVRLLLAEIIGHESGVCGGRGGSQHIKHGHFLSNGIQGGVAPIATGIALGEKTAGTGGVVVVCLGDGTLGQGVVYESLNLASLLRLPVLFLVEENGYAQTTPVALGVAGDIAGRGRAFGIESSELESSDVEEIIPWASACIDRVRSSGEPHWAVIHTCRLGAHSKGDDTRDPAEVAALAHRDPLAIQRARVSDEEAARSEAQVAERIARALESLEAMHGAQSQGSAS